MTRLSTILCLAAIAGCVGNDSLRQAYDAREELVRSQQQLCDSQQEALDSFKGRIESYERRWKAHSDEPVITIEATAPCAISGASAEGETVEEAVKRLAVKLETMKGGK